MKRVGFCAAMIIVAGTFLYGQSLGSITVATEEWEYCTQADGTGLYFDLLRSVFEPEGGRLDIRIMPYTRAVSQLEGKRADVVIGAYEDEIEQGVYPEWHFDNDIVSALYLKSAFPDFQGEASLSGRTVAWMRGYGYDEYFSQRMRVVEVDRRDNAINMVLANRVHVFLDAAVDIEFELESMDVDTSRLELTPIRYMKLYMVFADTDRGRLLARVWDRNFSRLLENGTIREMFEEWEFEDSYRF